MTHPAACPHCGGTFVNAVCPDLQLRDARLADDGTVVMGDFLEGVDWQYQDMLFCHTCSSTFAIPKDVKLVFDETLKTEHTPDYDDPKKGDPAYIGAEVHWEPVERHQVVIGCGGAEWIDLLGPIVDRNWTVKLTLTNGDSLEAELRRVEDEALFVGRSNDDTEDHDSEDTRIMCDDLLTLTIL